MQRHEPDGAVGLLASLAAAGSTLLMLHFLHRLGLSVAPDPGAQAPAGLAWPWLATAFAGLALPWTIFLASGIGTLADAASPEALWGGLWPVLLGVLLAALLRRWQDRLPHVPEGDVVAVGAAIIPAAVALGSSLERAEGALRQWPVAGVALLGLLLALGAAILGHGP